MSEEVKEILEKAKGSEEKMVSAVTSEIGWIRRVINRVKFITHAILATIRTIGRAAYAGIMVAVDYVLSLHSEMTTASWKRWAGTGLLVGAAVLVWFGLSRSESGHRLISGQMLTDIIKTTVMSIAGIYGAGALANGIANAGQGSGGSAAFSIVEKFKSFFIKDRPSAK